MTAPPNGRERNVREGPAQAPRRVTWAAAGLLSVHVLLIGLAAPRNAVTIDEFVHLPAGISYWHFGQFWAYHHNPPLVRLLFALPAVLTSVPIDYRNYQYAPATLGPELALARDFMECNRAAYVRVFVPPRLVVGSLSALAGLVVFAWSRRLFGDRGGLISLALWLFCPTVLAHAGLVTCDVGATAMGLVATYQFWRYLRAPTLDGALLAGMLLGLAEASKFTMVVLPAVWAVAVAARRWSRPGGVQPLPLGAPCAAMHALALALASLLTLNAVYLGEGAGQPLGAFSFRSKLLTRQTRGAGPGDVANSARVNRFRGTPAGCLPMPFPEHYLLGFDDQMFEVDSARYYKYLRGELRYEEPGWYSYYVYALLVKTPLGTLTLLVASLFAGVASRRCRADACSELLLLAMPLVVLTLVSSQRGINAHMRYVLPAFPFAFISAGRLAPWADGSRARAAFIALALFGTTASVIAVHPFYLAYFNEAAGGPDRGMEHLAESNLDSGQGLLALGDWLARHSPGRSLKLAYYGTTPPELLGISYEIPPYGPDVVRFGRSVATSHLIGPLPGLQAVSANYFIGLPFSTPDPKGGYREIPQNAYRYYRYFHARAIIAHSIFVYDISIDEANRVRRELGLAPLEHRSTTATGRKQPP